MTNLVEVVIESDETNPFLEAVTIGSILRPDTDGDGQPERIVCDPPLDVPAGGRVVFVDGVPAVE